MNDQYVQDGYAIVHDFLSQSQLATLRREFDKLYKPPTTNHVDEITKYHAKVFWPIFNTRAESTAIKDIIKSNKFRNALYHLTGLDTYYICIIKQPWANQTIWHADNPDWAFHSKDAISVWIPLDDVNLQNGCLYFIRGSHQVIGFDMRSCNINMDDLFQQFPTLKNGCVVPCPLEAGDCVYFNGLLAHAAGANMTPQFRRALAVAFVPKGTQWNGKSFMVPKAADTNTQRIEGYSCFEPADGR